MNTRRSIVFGAAAAAATVAIGSRTAWWPFSGNKNDVPTGDITELGWTDLIPDDFVQPEDPFITMSQEDIDKLFDGSDESKAELARMEKAFSYAPVVDQLDGQRVRIPAYITPLDYDGQTSLKEFLLVPYVGACIHTPPPPANQIVHALSDEAVDNPGMYEPVWAIGTIRTESIKSVLAESGYSLEVETVLPYTE